MKPALSYPFQGAVAYVAMRLFAFDYVPIRPTYHSPISRYGRGSIGLKGV